MTEKKFRGIVERLGGTISNPSCIVSFPDTLRINSRKDALDIMDILLQEGEQVRHFTVNLDSPFKELKNAIARGVV